MLIVLKMKMVPYFSAALTLAISPSGWAIFWRPVGDITIGIEILVPRTWALKDLLETSIIIRGLNLYLGKYVSMSNVVLYFF